LKRRRRDCEPGRRRVLRAIAASATAVIGAPLAAQDDRSGGITKTTMRCAEDIAGVRFEDTEEEAIARAASRLREHYNALRDLTLTADVPPSFSFRPPVPAHLVGKATPNAPLALGRATVHGGVPSGDELAFLPVVALADLLKRRLVSSTELARLYLDRLKSYDHVLQCVITLTEDLALEQAEVADREIRAGTYRGPLHGVPWGVKDVFATRGIRTTWGAKPFEHQMLDFDATVVERLRAAGAVLVAKLSTGELAGNDVWFGGKTKNPWNPALGSGGSSAGPAAATAAGLVAFSVGTDTGGSIIQPANTCGVVGLRPTYGRISRHGAMTLRWTMDKVGPLCREVEDCALVLNALYGPDGRDDTVADVGFQWKPNEPLASVRVGFVQHEFDEPRSDADDDARRVWPQRKELLARALDALRGIGVRLQPVSLPDFPVEATWRILAAESGAAFDEFVRSGAVRELLGKGPNERANQLRTSRFIPAVEYIQAQRARTLLGRHMEAVFAGCDVFLAPPDSASVLMTSMTGHPAVVVKAGFVDDLPQGIMITGRLYDEATVLRAARAYERASPWREMHPQLQPPP
jgi:Asp-tRNA(Asn)/Glu-tRNA(Gln) amidotransferase A subunit family amidase